MLYVVALQRFCDLFVVLLRHRAICYCFAEFVCYVLLFCRVFVLYVVVLQSFCVICLCYATILRHLHKTLHLSVESCV